MTKHHQTPQITQRSKDNPTKMNELITVATIEGATLTLPMKVITTAIQATNLLYLPKARGTIVSSRGDRVRQ